MLSSQSLASQWSNRARLTSGLALGALIACSSAESTPNGSAGGAGTAGTAAGASAAGAAAAGTTGVGGAGAAGAGTSGASTGGTAGAGGATAGAGGSAAGQGGATPGGSGGVATGGGGAGGVNNEPFALKSTAFKEGEEIPLAHKCAEVTPKGQNQSPPLSWGPGPPGTKSYAIVLNHVPTPEHWVLWDIPANVTSLAANIEHVAALAMPAGSKQSLADLDGFKGSGYLGPCPQMANSRQSYTFTLYALNVETVTGLTATSSPTAAATAVKSHLVPGSKGVSLTGTQIQTP